VRYACRLDPVGEPNLHERSLHQRIERARASGAYDRFVAKTEDAMLGLALAFAVVIVWPILDRDMDPTLRLLLEVLDGLIWAVFVAEYVVKLTLAPDRRAFFRTHLLDLLLIAIPPLRPLRALVVFRLLRLVGLVGFASRYARQRLAYRVGAYVAWVAAAILLVGAITAYEAERNAPGSNIRTFGDAVWWATTTMTTVGYGDRYPVTFQGRLVAVGLMVTGMALVGVITAGIAAWFVRHVSGLGRDVEAVEEKVDAVEHAIGEDHDEVLATLRNVSNRLSWMEDVVAEIAARNGYVPRPRPVDLVRHRPKRRRSGTAAELTESDAAT
jgi:voltage-gated potassium channel